MTKPASNPNNPVPAMKRADKRRADRELEYSRRDVRYMLIVVGLAVALLYTTLWLVGKLYGA
jgi:hypothetical protein